MVGYPLIRSSGLSEMEKVPHPSDAPFYIRQSLQGFCSYPKVLAAEKSHVPTQLHRRFQCGSLCHRNTRSISRQQKAVLRMAPDFPYRAFSSLFFMHTIPSFMWFTSDLRVSKFYFKTEEFSPSCMRNRYLVD